MTRASLIPAVIIVACLVAPARADLGLLEVGPGLYRAKNPVRQEDFDEIKRLGIRTVLDVRAHRRYLMNREERELAARGICYKNIPFSFHPQRDNSPEQAYREMLNVADYPLLVHCQFDRDRTSILIGFYRVRMQGWSVAAAAREIEDSGLKDWLGNLWPYFYSHVVRSLAPGAGGSLAPSPLAGEGRGGGLSSPTHPDDTSPK